MTAASTTFPLHPAGAITMFAPRVDPLMRDLLPAATCTAILLLVASADSAGQSSPKLFDSPLAYALGISPRDVAVGNLNGDAIPDLAVSNSASNTVSVLMGLGDGSFSDPVDYVVANNPVYPFGPQGVAIGDLDGDGWKDIAVADEEGGKVAVLFATGGGNFAAAEKHDLGGYPEEVAFADMDQDGDQDLVVSNATGRVQLLLNQGSGVLGAPTDYAANVGAYRMTVGRVNQDSRPDVIVGGILYPTAQVVVLLGQPGPVLLGPATYYPLQDNVGVTDVGLADLDADGKADLVACLYGADDGSAVVMLNQGGTFGAPTFYELGAPTGRVATAYLDAGPTLDLVIANGTSSSDSVWNAVSVLLGNGDGTFEPPMKYPAGTWPDGLATLDCNQDQRADVVVVSFTGDNVSPILGNGDGTLATVPQLPVGARPRAVISADLNRDGHLDLVAANEDSDSVSVLLGDGRGGFGPSTEFPAGNGPISLCSVDINDDGVVDVVTANHFSNNLSILIGSGDGALSAPLGIAVGGGPQSVAAGRLNADDVEDLVVAVANGGSGTISVLLGKPSHGFQPPVNYSVGSLPTSLALADMDADGLLDVVVSKALYAISVLLNQGGGILGTPTDYAVSGSVGGRGLAVGYLDCDRYPDVVVSRWSSLSVNDSVSIFMGQPGGLLSGDDEVQVAQISQDVALGDVDGDGHLDIAVTCSGSAAVSVLPGNGDGMVSPPIHYSTPNRCWGLCLSDVDEDARLDLVVAGIDGDVLSASLNVAGAPIAIWKDLGFGLAGASGTPSLGATGSLVAGSCGALTLTHAAPTSLAVLFASLIGTPVPFKCGTLAASPIALMAIATTNAKGLLRLGWSAWPASISGLDLYFQFGVQDVAAPCGVSLSNAITAHAP